MGPDDPSGIGIVDPWAQPPPPTVDPLAPDPLAPQPDGPPLQPPEWASHWTFGDQGGLEAPALAEPPPPTAYGLSDEDFHAAMGGAGPAPASDDPFAVHADPGATQLERPTPDALEPPDPYTMGLAEADQGAAEVARRGLERQWERDAIGQPDLEKAQADSAARRDANLAAWEQHRAAAAADGIRLRQEAKRLSEERIDSSGRRTTGQQIAGIFAAAIGGMYSRENGGRNAALERMQDVINSDIDAQKADLSRRMDLLGMEQGQNAQDYAQAHENYLALEAQRLGMLESARERVASERLKYDPRGTKAQELAELEVGLRAKTAEAAAKAEKEALDRRKILHDMEVQDRTFESQERARRAAAGASKRDEDHWLYEHGAMRDATGRLVPDPNAAKAPLKPGELTKAVGDEQAARGDILTDSQGNVLGKPRVAANAQAIVNQGVSYEQFRTTLQKIGDLLAKQPSSYRGLGSERWPSEVRTQFDALRQEAAQMLAKARDPQSTIRESELELALKAIPEMDGWTTSRNPMTVYRTTAKTADDKYDLFLGGNLEGEDGKAWDRSKSPTRRYQAADRLIEKAADTAQPRAEIISEATAPPSGLTRNDPEARDSAIGARSEALDKLGDREGGITAKENADVSASLLRDLKNGDLTQDEYVGLRSKLDALTLTRSAEPGEAVRVKSAERDRPTHR